MPAVLTSPGVSLSAIVPTLDEAAALPRLLRQLTSEVDEVIVADGGSTDGTQALARAAGARVVEAVGGRGPQLNAGADRATGRRLWFLHADTLLPDGLGATVRSAPGRWGCCAVRVGSRDLRLRWCGRAMNLRARLTGSCTGDMGMWVDRALFLDLGGFAPLAALEDLELSDRLRAAAPWTVLAPRLTTSARRWEAHGVNRTMVQLWALRLGYRLGVDPRRLAATYQRRPRETVPPPGALG